MIQDHTSDSSPAERSALPDRPKRTAAMVILLAYLTLANTFGFVLGIVGWADWSDHGSRYDDELLQAAIFTTFGSAVALIGLGGTWFTRIWGPRLYASVAGVSLLIGLVLGTFSLFSLVGVLIAIGLWQHAEKNW